MKPLIFTILISFCFACNDENLKHSAVDISKKSTWSYDKSYVILPVSQLGIGRKEAHDIDVSEEELFIIFDKVETHVNLYNDSLVKAKDFDTIPLSEMHVRQVICYEDLQGNKIVFLQYSCGHFNELTVKTLNFISDIGSCLFNVKYDIKRGVFTEMYVDGYA